MQGRRPTGKSFVLDGFCFGPRQAFLGNEHCNGFAQAKQTASVRVKRAVGFLLHGRVLLTKVKDSKVFEAKVAFSRQGDRG